MSHKGRFSPNVYRCPNANFHVTFEVVNCRSRKV